jgi:hypothetical protein
MLLYHGTSEKVALAVIKGQDGLRPRGKKSGNWKHTIPSRKDAVYLTQAYAAYYAMCTVEGKERWAVFEIDGEKLNPFKLAPDEDALEQVGRNRDDVPGNMNQRTVWYRKRLHNLTHLVELSLNTLGNCCYLDSIPQLAIKRVALIDPRGCPTFAFQAMDPVINIMNYHICQSKYRGLTKWIFGNDLGEDEPTLRATFQDGTKWMDWNIPPDSEREAIEIRTVLL